MLVVLVVPYGVGGLVVEGEGRSPERKKAPGRW